ncbi:hypothetical protein [Mesorhizobium sp. Cs1299R1N3]|uniref:hypothetical protein n=1 Tax=Mesorhizobium sp. Cs1299R1N3 TaxID=3015173 RepID=UPI00301D17B1
MSAREWTVYTTEDFEPWAIFVAGHVSLDDMHGDDFREAMIDLLKEQGFDSDDAQQSVEGGAVGHFWIRQGEEHAEDFDEEFPWFWSKEGVAGAIPITGMRFAP